MDNLQPSPSLKERLSIVENGAGLLSSITLGKVILFGRKFPYQKAMSLSENKDHIW